MPSQNLVKESFTLEHVQFGLMGAFRLKERGFKCWYRLHRNDTHIVWVKRRDLTAVNSKHLEEFRIAENFFLDKQLFFGGKEAIPSYPPQLRGHLQKETSVTFKFGSIQNGILVLNNIRVLLAYFKDQKVLTVFLFTTLPPLSVDQLIFLKQAKWYPIGDKGWSLTLDKPKPARVHSVHELMFELLASYGLALPKTERTGESAAWPIFDFINLRDVRPSTHTSNWEGARQLTRAQHFGLLVGDEGYRLIDEGAVSHYTRSLEDANTQLRGRDYFLYQFAATSCLAFYAPNIAETKTIWANWYKDQIGHVPILDSYIRLVPEVPCLADGVPLRVEVCLLRYIELWGISRELETKAGRTSGLWQRASRLWQWPLRLLQRALGLTPLENAIHALERLDLYQDSALWIIGGRYADQLYQYSAIRERVDRSVRNIQLAESEINRTRLTHFTLLFSLIALGFSFANAAWNPFSRLMVNKYPVAYIRANRTVECNGPDGGAVTLNGEDSYDPDHDMLRFTWRGPFEKLTDPTIRRELGIGTHSVKLMVDDGKGGVSSDTVDILVQDTTAPTLIVKVRPAHLWPPNHRMVRITADVVVKDICDSAPLVELVSVTSNERDYGTGKDDKRNDVQDVEKGKDDRSFLVRAERANPRTERVYTVTYRARDRTGKASRRNNLIKFERCALKRDTDCVHGKADRVEVPIACVGVG